MKDRILAFLQNENKSYAQFAEEIGVQPSGISHILSGRNNPSLDFVVKMLHRYPALSADWLLFGRAPMYRYASQPTLFADEPPGSLPDEGSGVEHAETPDNVETPRERREMHSYAEKDDTLDHDGGQKSLERVLMFYSDKTFTEYTPF